MKRWFPDVLCKGVPTQMVLTANPGGAGQNWLRERYRLVPFPRGPKVSSARCRTGRRIAP